MKMLRTFLARNTRQIAMIVAVFIVTGIMMNSSLIEYQANLLAGVKSDPFNGTTVPVKRVPSWVDLTSSEWKMSYEQIPQNKFIDLPVYQPGQLTIPMSSLDFSKPADKAVRNAQVTYSTPYMGNYKLDGQEYAGSHLAVDIKIPSGTPVYAIANGIVVKAANQSGGFGQHVVLRHDDVPSLDNANTKTVYFSGYAHLSNFSVSEGQKVAKGTLIGYSGNSGTTTTPHLHFQIDNELAPWHPYWPFTSKEASDAGLDFWSAINAGLGKDKAMQTTVSPMAYVQKYLDASGQSSTAVPPATTNSVTPGNTVSEDPLDSQPSTVTDQIPPVSTTADPVTLTGQPSVTVNPSAPKLADFELIQPDSFKVDSDVVFKVIALDETRTVIENYQPDQEWYLKVENGSGTLSSSYLGKADFNKGIAEFKVKPTAEYGLRISVTAGQIVKYSEMMQAASFTDVEISDDSYVAINFLKNNEIVRGYPDGTFKPGNPVSRVEALKFIYEGLNKEVKTSVVLEFADTDSKAWYARYIAAAQKEQVVKGYPGNLFKPANSVTKAEFVKMLVQAAGYNGENYQPLKENFADVKKGDWYYGYVGLAKDKNLLDTSSNLFHPNQSMTRAEVAQILYKTIMLQVSRSRSYDRNLVVSAEDLADYYRSV
jgi:murein DD-endopeptidase MepM/ murein hydrolase activator NlpD